MWPRQGKERGQAQQSTYLQRINVYSRKKKYLEAWLARHEVSGGSGDDRDGCRDVRDGNGEKKRNEDAAAVACIHYGGHGDGRNDDCGDKGMEDDTKEVVAVAMVTGRIDGGGGTHGSRRRNDDAVNGRVVVERVSTTPTGMHKHCCAPGDGRRTTTNDAPRHGRPNNDHHQYDNPPNGRCNDQEQLGVWYAMGLATMVVAGRQQQCARKLPSSLWVHCGGDGWQAPNLFQAKKYSSTSSSTYCPSRRQLSWPRLMIMVLCSLFRLGLCQKAKRVGEKPMLTGQKATIQIQRTNKRNNRRWLLWVLLVLLFLQSTQFTKEIVTRR